MKQAYKLMGAMLLLSVMLLANCETDTWNGGDYPPADPGLLDKLIEVLENANSKNVFLYQTP
jgi:hypothetical protein